MNEIPASFLKQVSDLQANALFIINKISWQERCNRIYGLPIEAKNTDAECGKEMEYVVKQ
jgi:hypothetical protein